MYYLTLADLIDQVFDAVRQPNSSANELLTEPRIRTAINEGYAQFAIETRCYTRTITLTVVDGQATYDLPRDLAHILRVRYSDTQESTGALRRADTRELERYSVTWETDAAGTPVYWYHASQGVLGLYPAPDTTESETITVQAAVIPYSVGKNITHVARTSNVATITTAAAHGLHVGEAITLSGITTAGFSATAQTVIAVPTTTTLTYANTGGDVVSTGDTTGYISYSSGKLPLVADTDQPSLLQIYFDALVGFAAYRLCSGYLRDWPYSAERGQAGLAQFQELVGRYHAEQVL